MGFDYYKDLPDFVSNSDLGRLKELIYGIERPSNLKKIFDFGNLVDAKKTEPFRFREQTGTLHDDGGRIIQFEPAEIRRADRMVDALNRDETLSRALDGALYQYVVLRKAEPITWDGETIHLPMRMKADAYQRGNMLIDIKTTGCTSYKSFVESIFFFDYDRQGAVYMDLARVPRALYAGVSKEPNKRTGQHEVFKFLIERGDATYLSGLRKKNFLGYKFHTLIRNLQLPPQIISI